MQKKINDNNFNEEVKQGLKLIEFFTTWCGYCKKQEAELNQMDKIWIGQIDADESPKLSARFNVRAYPTFLIFKNGEEVERFSGFRKKEEIMNILMNHF